MLNFFTLKVEIIFNEWFHRILSIRLLHSLLYDKTDNNGHDIDSIILRLYTNYGLSILLTFWNCWLFRLFLVCQKDIQCCQS
jgi:two-component sensor histidine kinase